MPLGHALARLVKAVAGILGDVVRADHPVTCEGRGEHGRVPRHGELGEGFPRRAGQGVEHVALSPLVLDIVEERPELGPADLHPGVDDGLHQPVQVQVARHRRGGPVQDLQGAGLLLQLRLLGPELGLGRQSFADVDKGADRPLQPPVAPDRSGAILDRKAGPVGAIETLALHVGRLAERGRAVHRAVAFGVGPAVGTAVVDQTVDVAPHHLILVGEAEHGQEGAVDGGGRPVCVDGVEGLGGGVQQLAQIVPAFALLGERRFFSGAMLTSRSRPHQVRSLRQRAHPCRFMRFSHT